MAKIEEKKPIVAEISEFIDGAQSVVAVDYRGLTVAQDTELRKSLREAGVVYKVYKNTFLTRAFEGTDFAQLDKVLEGPTAVAISKDDATAPALEIKAGVVEGTFYDANGMQSISQIPSREELLSKFLGSIQSPITNFARCVKQIAEKGGEAAPAAEAPAEAPAEEAAAEAPAEA